jgi:hypothetical protein
MIETKKSGPEWWNFNFSFMPCGFKQLLIVFECRGKKRRKNYKVCIKNARSIPLNIIT